MICTRYFYECPRIAPETKPRPGTPKTTFYETPNYHLDVLIGPDMARRTKEKSDPGKAAPCENWSG